MHREMYKVGEAKSTRCADARFWLFEHDGLIVIVVRSDLCFQERARSRIGGSPEEALHDRGVFSGHYDECCGPGACQGIPNPKTTITRKPPPNQTT